MKPEDKGAETTPPANGQAPATPPASQTTTPPGNGQAQPVDPVEYGKLKAEREQLLKERDEFKKYKEQVDPVLETLWSDKELLDKATETHNKRLGKTKPATTTTPGQPQTPPRDNDTRNSQIMIIQDRFEEKTGISKLDAEKQKEVRGLVGTMLKEMLDPNNNKTINQVFEEVSLQKLPWYLEQAYTLATKDSQLQAARESGKAEVLNEYAEGAGAIGSMASTSAAASQVTLTPKEREVAQRMNISEEDYLKQKQAINESRNRG